MGNVYSLLCPGMAPTYFIPGLPGGRKTHAAKQHVRPRRCMVYSTSDGSCNNVVVKIIEELDEDDLDIFHNHDDDPTALSPARTPQEEEKNSGLHRSGSIYASRDFTELARRQREKSRENLAMIANNNNAAGDSDTHLKITGKERLVKVIKVSNNLYIHQNRFL